MRDEMLKRLDGLIEGINRYFKGPENYGLMGWDDAMAALRDELASERCENCTHWRSADGGSMALCMKLGSYLYQVATVYHYCCPHFEKKEPAK